MSDYQPTMGSETTANFLPQPQVPPYQLIDDRGRSNQQHEQLEGTKTYMMSNATSTYSADEQRCKETPSILAEMDTNGQNHSTNLVDCKADESAKESPTADSIHPAYDANCTSSKMKISTTVPQGEDQTSDPFFSGKIGKKKLATKHKLYSEKIKRHKISMHILNQQQTQAVGNDMTPSSNLVRNSEYTSKSHSAQNQHIKKAKLLASSEHRKHVDQKTSLVKPLLKCEEKFEALTKLPHQGSSTNCQKIFDPLIENIKSDSSSQVPLSYETVEIVTTEKECDIVSTSSADNLVMANDDDSTLQNDNDLEESPFEGDSSSDILTRAVQSNQHGKDDSGGFVDKCEATQPKEMLDSEHVKCAASSAPSKCIKEKSAQKSVLHSCELCSFTSISTVIFVLFFIRS